VQLKTHLLKSHNEGTWFTCDICEKKFVNNFELKLHSYQHADVKPYVCCECPKSFCTAARLKSHQLVHSVYKQFCCGKCGKLFKDKYCVKRHFDRCSNDRLGIIGVFNPHVSK